jgi:hypothetical protein
MLAPGTVLVCTVQRSTGKPRQPFLRVRCLLRRAACRGDDASTLNACALAPEGPHASCGSDVRLAAECGLRARASRWIRVAPCCRRAAARPCALSDCCRVGAAGALTPAGHVARSGARFVSVVPARRRAALDARRSAALEAAGTAARVTSRRAASPDSIP